MSAGLTEADVEQIAIELFQELGYTHIFGGDIAPETPGAERESYSEVCLPDRILNALIALNPSIPRDSLEEAMKRATRTTAATLLSQNHTFYRMLVDGVDVTYRQGDRIVNDRAILVDFENPEKNEWLIINQYTIV